MNYDKEYSLIKDVVESSLIKEIFYRGRKYYYIINPISTGIPEIKPALLDAICKKMLEKWPKSKIDYILTFEAMGIHIGSVLSIKTGISLIIAKKKRYLDEVIEIKRENDRLYIPNTVKNARIVIVDSILSSGKTIIETIKKLEKNNVIISGIYVVINRVDYGGAERVFKETNYRVESIVDVYVGEEGVKVLARK